MSLHASYRNCDFKRKRRYYRNSRHACQVHACIGKKMDKQPSRCDKSDCKYCPTCLFCPACLEPWHEPSDKPAKPCHRVVLVWRVAKQVIKPDAASKRRNNGHHSPTTPSSLSISALSLIAFATRSICQFHDSRGSSGLLAALPTRESSSGRSNCIFGITPRILFFVFFWTSLIAGARRVMSPLNLFIKNPFTSFL